MWCVVAGHQSGGHCQFVLRYRTVEKRTVGLRELGQNVSRVFDTVKKGESLVVTEHGRAIAKIVPLRESGVLDQLIEEGEERGPTLELAAFLALPAPTAEGGLASEALAELRKDER